MKLKKIILVGITSLLLLVSTLSQTAYAAGGNVFDGNSREIVGMWVEVQGGKSGWAKLIDLGLKHSKGWYYDTQGKPYQVHVSVGGTPQRWFKTALFLY